MFLPSKQSSEIGPVITFIFRLRRSHLRKCRLHSRSCSAQNSCILLDSSGSLPPQVQSLSKLQIWNVHISVALYSAPPGLFYLLLPHWSPCFHPCPLQSTDQATVRVILLKYKPDSVTLPAQDAPIPSRPTRSLWPGILWDSSGRWTSLTLVTPPPGLRRRQAAQGHRARSEGACLQFNGLWGCLIVLIISSLSVRLISEDHRACAGDWVPPPRMGYRPAPPCPLGPPSLPHWGTQVSSPGEARAPPSPSALGGVLTGRVEGCGGRVPPASRGPSSLRGTQCVLARRLQSPGVSCLQWGMVTAAGREAFPFALGPTAYGADPVASGLVL